MSISLIIETAQAYGQNIQCGRYEYPLRGGGERGNHRTGSADLLDEFGWAVLQAVG